MRKSLFTLKILFSEITFMKILTSRLIIGTMIVRLYWRFTWKVGYF